MGENHSSAKAATTGIRLPRYTTHASLRAMGFTEDMVSVLHPLSTPIAYPESDVRNLREKLFHEFGNPGDRHTPSYLAGSFVIKCEATQSGGKPLLQAHPAGTPSSSWHASPEELRTALQDTPPEDMAMRVKAILDLTRTPGQVSMAEVIPAEKGSFHAAELSFNRVGTQQVFINNKNMRYSETTSIDTIHKILGP